MANYADGLTDLNLDNYLEFFYQHNKIASFLAVKPSHSYHVVSIESNGRVSDIRPVTESNTMINGGFFVFKQQIFDYIREGEDLVQEPFLRLISTDELIAYQNPGFWASIDTFKEKKMFDAMFTAGNMPWVVWESSNRKNQQEKLIMSHNGLADLAIQERSHLHSHLSYPRQNMSDDD
jgi:glucose-1-phosphate cytidylyltransferase